MSGKEKPNRANVSTGAIEVSLTSFADYVLKHGLPKLTCAQNIRKQYEEGYRPGRDYYKRFRDTVISHHKHGRPIGGLADAVNAVADAAKAENYKILGRGYTRFWNTQLEPLSVGASDRLVGSWKHGKVTVRVNPELCFADERSRYAVKLYCKPEPLTKPQVNVILHLMQLGIRASEANAVCLLVDVRRSKAFEASVFNPKWTVVLEAECLSFERMYSAEFDDFNLPDAGDE